MKRTKYFWLILQLSVAQFSDAQTPADSVARPIQEINIDAGLLVDFWESADSLKNRIEFVDRGYEIVLETGADARPYYFSMDEQRKVFASGFFPNWPPYNCDLKFVSPDTLEIEFSVLDALPYHEKYVRPKR